MTKSSFLIEGREESEEFLESEKPALDQLIAMGYEYKTQQEINLERQDYRQVLLYQRLKNAIIKINPEFVRLSSLINIFDYRDHFLQRTEP